MQGTLRTTVLALAGACYQPAIPAGVPCSTAGDCPGDQACVESVCGGPGSVDAAGSGDAPPGVTVVVVGADRAQVGDTAVSIASQSTNLGTEDHFSVDDGESGLLGFDLSGVPAGLAVTRATLRVVTADEASLDGGTVLIYRVLERWDENAATWTMRTSGRAWASTGVTPPSREDAPIAELRPNRTFTPFEVAIPAALIEAWRAAPPTNFGLVFVRGTSTQHVHIASREAGQWSTLTLELGP